MSEEKADPSWFEMVAAGDAVCGECGSEDWCVAVWWSPLFHLGVPEIVGDMNDPAEPAPLVLCNTCDSRGGLIHKDEWEGERDDPSLRETLEDRAVMVPGWLVAAGVLRTMAVDCRAVGMGSDDHDVQDVQEMQAEALDSMAWCLEGAAKECQGGAVIKQAIKRWQPLWGLRDASTAVRHAIRNLSLRADRAPSCWEIKEMSDRVAALVKGMRRVDKLANSLAAKELAQ